MNVSVNFEENKREGMKSEAAEFALMVGRKRVLIHAVFFSSAQVHFNTCRVRSFD